jgi:hypothetical protein
MTAYVITIGTGKQHNWDIAKAHSMWATPKAYGIEAGDDLFFWQAPEGLVAHWKAAADETPVSDPSTLPWPDSADMHYTREFPMVEVATLHEPFSPWSRLRELAGTNAGPNLGVIRILDEAARDRIASLFPASDDSAVAEAVVAVEVARSHIDSEQDARVFVEASIVRRQGQPQFREQLLKAWGRRCAISGCDAEPALEAAHVRPYLGPHTNSLGNGLPLRADLHTLFDRLLITIDPDTWTVVLAPALQNTVYAELAGTRVLIPESVPQDELAQRLTAHRDQVLAG